MIQVAYAIVWWLILVVIGLITFPLVSRVCGRLPDKGYSVSKILGLVFLTYFSWLFASLHLLKFGYIDISVVFVLLLALSFYLGRKSLNLKTLPLKSMLISEAIFTVAFALFLVYIRYKPDIFYAYSEDFMDFAFLQSILRSSYFPPADAWLSGFSLPYYYGGQVTVAILTLASKVPSSISYNLAIASFFGLVATASYGIGYSLTGRKLYGFVALVFVSIVGYISGVFELSAFVFHHHLLDYSDNGARTFWGWLVTFDVGTGVIPHTEQLYPYAAFLQRHLHAYLMSIPFQLMFLTLILSLLKKDNESFQRGKWDWLLVVFVLGISLGFFLLLNTWDYPIYAALIVLVFLFFRLNISRKCIAPILLLSLLCYVPYFTTRGWSGAQGIGIVHGRTELADFVELFALFLFVAFSFFYVWFKGRVLKGEKLILVIVFFIILAALSFLLNFQLLLVLAPLILIPLYCILKSRKRAETELMFFFVLMAALLVLFCEIFFINDSLSGLDERYNTVMKFYFPVWILLAIASAYGVFRVMQRAAGKLKGVWVGALIVLIICCLMQPVGQTIGWASGKRSYFNIGRGTLDGTAYVKTIAPGDYEAIQWINANIRGQPVILEAPGGAYQFTSYIATMTGLPTVVGWVTHEVMWRGSWEPMSERSTDVDNIYNSPDSDEALALLKKYNVEYVYVGKAEAEKYPAESLQQFTSNPERYKIIYQNQGVVIYQVTP